MRQFLQSILSGQSGDGVCDLCLDYPLIASQHPGRFENIGGMDLFPDLEVLSIRQQELKSMRGLQTLTVLRELDLGLNEIDLVEGLENLTRLEKLNLSHNLLKSLGSMPAFPDLIELDLGFNQLDSIKSMPELRNLRILILNGNRKLKTLDGLPQHLEALHLRQCHIHDWQGLLESPSVQRFTYSPSGVEGLRILESLLQLRSVTIAAERCIGNLIFPAIPHLNDLYLQKATNVGRLSGMENLPSLTTLGITRSTLDRLPEFGSASKVEILDLSGSRIGNLEGLAALASLRTLKLGGAQLPFGGIEKLLDERKDVRCED